MRTCWVKFGNDKEIDAILYLGCEFVPQLDGELAISCSEGADESILERFV